MTFFTSTKHGSLSGSSRRRSTNISIGSNRNRTDRGWKRAQNRILKTRNFKIFITLLVALTSCVDVNENDEAKAKLQVEDMCKKLLANLVIEDYKIL